MTSSTATSQAFSHRGQPSLYGYIPTEWICIFFVVLFSITTLLHTIQAFVYKRPKLLWTIPTFVMCGIAEIIGWGGRLASSHNPYDLKFFIIQSTTTVIAPTFLTAGLYTVFGIITQLGPQYSRLPPRAYFFTFLAADAAALGVQAFGGAYSSISFEHGQSPATGGNIMMIGIVIQLVSILLYMVLATEFFLRFHLGLPIPGRVPATRQEESPESFVDKASLKDMESSSDDVSDKKATSLSRGIFALPLGTFIVVGGIVFSTFLVLIRSGYRTVELSGGWTGPVVTTETYFNHMDGATICLAMFTLNILHPQFVY